ncbi:MAG: glycogen-binding domain-containing protein, partial [Bacteroidales bacterium]|nr:glycogen-binding domain-containing protein [Bacteroidales bacterium]
MKKITLLFALMLFFSVTFAQKYTVNENAGLVDRHLYKPLVKEAPALKTEGEIFYSETFDFKDSENPRGWTLPEGWNIVDENDMGHYWVWRAGTDSIKGKYTFEPGHRYSKTPEDGYFVLPMDEYNYVDGVSTSNGGHAWFQMAPIDCSEHPSVVMKLRQYFRNCCGSTYVKIFISNDQGVHWAEYNMAYGTTTNVFCKKPIVEVNISEVAAGMPDVWVKFEWDNNSHYFWCIDDFELMEGYTNEIQLTDSWVMMSDLYDDDNDEGYVFMTPLSQINGVLGGWTFKGAFVNAGRDDQYNCHLNAQIFKNGTSVYNENSESRDIWSLDRDTFDITTPYFPDDYGTYKFTMEAKQDQEDAVPSNNNYMDFFNVTDSVYSIADWDYETYSSTASWGNNDGDYLGILYDITQATEVNSMSVFIMQRPENPQASTQVGYGFQYFIFKWDEEAQDWIEIISAEYGEVTEDNLNTWITMPMDKDGESEFMEPGQYIAAIQVWHGGGAGPDNNVYRFTIGSDLDHKYNKGKSLFKLISGDVWNVNDTDLSMIRLNLNYTGAPTTGSVTFNVDMTLPITNGYFHPDWEFVDVAGTFNDWGGSAHMEDPDGDGIYTLTINDIPVFQQIEYKYRINGNWDTSEFPLGGPNRTYITSYWNELNDVYNNGVSMG